MASTRARAAARPDDDWQRLDRQLCFALYSASLATTKLYKPLLEPLGLTYPQYLVLLALWERDGPSVGELGEQLFLDSGTLTPLLKRLQAAGWITRERASDDERRVHIHLSPSGRALKARARLVPRELAAATGCTPEELAAVTDRLQQLRAHLLDATASRRG